MTHRFGVVATALAVLLVGRMSVAASPLRFGGVAIEVRAAAVSEHTLRLEVVPQEKGSDFRGQVNGEQGADLSTVLEPLKIIREVRVRELTNQKKVRVEQFRVFVQAEPLTIGVERQGRRVQELSFEEGTNCSVTFHSQGPVLGLGEGGKQFDRRGNFFPMINGQLSPLLATHGATIPVPFLIGTEGWALFVHRPWGEFDLRESKLVFRFKKESLAREPLEVLVIDAPQPEVALAEFVRLTGHPVMPPKWTMGYIQSHRTLLGPDDALQIAQTFREKHLPCDALIYLGTGYCTNGWNVANGTIDFNTNAFPRPAEQIKALHAQHFKVILHVNQAPRNLFGLTVGPAFSASPSESVDIFGRGPYLTRAQRQALGEPVATGTAADFKSPLHIRNYWAWHQPVFALGVDGWWPDDGDELSIEARLARHRCYYEGPLLDRPNERPWGLHRNGFAGAARYGGWIWSGDTMSRWATLAAHVPVGLNYSLSLTPFWGSDIGGFVATSELTGELYTRWFQFAAFNPLFRSHGRTWHLRLPWGWNTGEYGPIETPGRPDPSELHNAEVEPICRKYLELRYRLLPYNYTLMREACDTGLPPMRALWLHYPRDPEAVKLGDEYLWGRDILVAPVVEKGAKVRRVYLPAGEWYDFWTNEKMNGSRWIERPVDLATMPLYVRAGAIIPLDPIRQYTSERGTEPTTLSIYPGTNGSYTLYDDDGATLDYQKDIATWTGFRWDDRANVLTIEPDRRSSQKALPRKFEVLMVTTGERKIAEYEGRRMRVKMTAKSE